MKTAGVDLDGTIAQYTTWKGVKNIGRPLGLFLVSAALRSLKQSGFKIIIFTTRASEKGGPGAVRAWLRRHALLQHVSGVTSKKLPFTVMFDDRAWHVNTNQRGGLLAAVDHFLQEQQLTGGDQSGLVSSPIPLTRRVRVGTGRRAGHQPVLSVTRRPVDRFTKGGRS